MSAEERLAPVMARLQERIGIPVEKSLPRKIQSWVEYFASDAEQAKAVHNHAIKLLNRYHSSRTSPSPDEITRDAIQVSNFLNSSDLSFPPSNADVYTTKTRLDIGAPTDVVRRKTEEMVTKYAQEVLIASLFNINRAGLGDRLSKTMELDQIEAVAKSVIEGDHIQLATGQGKSSTVIPIASIVESLTSQDKSAVVVSINKNLVSDLEAQTKSLIGEAGKRGMAIPLFTENRSKEDESVGGETKKRMMREALTNDSGEYSEEIQREVFTTYWGEDIEGKRSDFIDRVKDARGGRRITFMSKDDFVFNLSRGGDAFIQACPKVFFDEIDAPYIIGETYQSTHEDLFISKSNLIDMASRYTLDRIVLSQINPDEDFEVFKGSGTLSEEGRTKLESVDWSGFFKGTSRDRTMKRAFEEATETIGKHLDLDGEEIKHLRDKVWDHMSHALSPKRNRGKSEDKGNYAISGAAGNLASGYYSLNKIFISEGEGITVRSDYFDQLMENHKFDPDTHISMLALTNKFSIVNLLPKASDSIKFPTVLAKLGSKVVGFSGTLVQRDLMTGKPVSSPLANFLRTVTGKEIFEVTPPENKRPPSPKIAEDIAGMEAMLQEVIGKEEDGKPILIVSHYDTKTTREIFDQLTSVYGNGFKVDILPSIPSDPDRLDEYYRELKKKTRALADNRKSILVSSGSLGIGANIIKSDATFPDLRVGILGLPENESKLRQNLGRRRMKGNDFFWIVDKQSLRERATWLNSQEGTIIKAFLTPKKAEDAIDAINNGKGDDNLRFVLRLMHDAHITTITNEDFTVAYDSFFKKDVLPAARYFLEQRLKKAYFSKDTDWEKDGEALIRLNRLERIFGLPDNLYERLLQPDITLGIQSSDTREYITKLKMRVVSEDIIKDAADTWFHQIREGADYVESKIYKGGKQKIHQFFFLEPPKNSGFRLQKHTTLNMPGGISRTVDLGMVSLSDRSLPGIQFPDGKVYLIGNIGMGQLAQMDNLFLYTKGSKNIMFSPVAK